MDTTPTTTEMQLVDAWRAAVAAHGHTSDQAYAAWAAVAAFRTPGAATTEVAFDDLTSENAATATMPSVLRFAPEDGRGTAWIARAAVLAQLTPTTPAPTTAFARTDLATASQAALGIEAYALHIPNIFDPAGPKDIQGWVCSPRMSHPQYVGYAIESDGATALQRLEARIGQFARDIEEELVPPSPPAAPAAPSRRAGKKTVRAARKPLGCQCPACLRTSPPDSGVYGCSAGLEYHIYAAPDNYLGCRKDYREAIDVLSTYRIGGRRAA